MSQKTLVCIVGPTAVGKTSVGISLAKTFGSEIISADSRQFYAEMNIGTAKPSPEELADAPHHFVGFLSVKEAYSAGDFERDALKKLDELFRHHDLVFLVGGSGLFVQAVCRGMDELPVVEEQIREKYNRLFAEEGLPILQQLLEEKDPVYYQTVDRQNPQRVIRALEVIEATGKPFSDLHKKNWVKRAFDVVTIGLDLPREILYQRINKR
ncbi:MAG: tRNA (adenosine(37)-N6)-dimethylallyltransferase MiaA, partial [Mucilaginibacter polytrichastri]|nr:tRNA (adenosine(37)-N6)-dimethylallyltransferase MiaA [Mucilaginibacter polytrichastri]